MSFKSLLPILVFLGLVLGLVHGVQGITMAGEVRQTAFIMLIGVSLRFFLRPAEETPKVCLAKALLFNGIMAASAYVGLGLWILGRHL